MDICLALLLNELHLRHYFLLHEEGHLVESCQITSEPTNPFAFYVLDFPFPLTRAKSCI